MGTDWRDEYWRECIAVAAEECGASLTSEQIGYIADAAQGSHENYDMASGPVPESPYKDEAERLRKELKIEKNKIICQTCDGTGTTHTYGGTFMSTSRCWKCNGYGRHSP